MALTERLQILIDANAGGAIAEFKKVGTATHGLNASAATGTKQLGGLGQAASAAGGALKAGLAGGVMAAWTAIAAFGVSAITTFNDLAQSVLKFQRVSGATAEESSALIAAFDDMGIEAETGSKAIFALATRLKTSKDDLAGFGIAAAKNSAGNTDMAATLMRVADAYVGTTDAGKRAELLTAAFGKRIGADLIPILEKGSEAIADLYASAEATGQILSQEDIAKAENFRIAMDELEDSVGSLTIAAGQHLVPAITKIVDAFSAAIEKAREWGDLPVIKQAGELIGEVFRGATGGMFDAAAGAGAVTDAFTDVADAAAQGEEDLDALSKTMFSAETASRSLADAQRSLDTAQRGLVEATTDYNKLVKDGAVDEEKVADARRSLAEATRSAADADRGLVKAQREYNEASAAFAVLGTDTASDNLADAAEGLADAQDTSASAHERATEAARDLKAAQAGDPEFQKKLADAKQGVTDATQGVADATYNLGKRSYENVVAHEAETEAISEKADQVERLRTELQTILALHPEQSSVLGPILASLPPPGSAPINWTGPIGGGGDFSPLTAPASNGSVATTNNVTVNVASPYVDPVGIAKNVVWELN
jgi:hypothetical protein